MEAMRPSWRTAGPGSGRLGNRSAERKNRREDVDGAPALLDQRSVKVAEPERFDGLLRREGEDLEVLTWNHRPDHDVTDVRCSHHEHPFAAVGIEQVALFQPPEVRTVDLTVRDEAMDHEVRQATFRFRSGRIVAECVVSHRHPPGGRGVRRTERLLAYRLRVEASGCFRELRRRTCGNRSVEIGRAEQPDGPTLGKRTFEDADRRRPDDGGAPSGGAHCGESGVGSDGIDDDEGRPR